MYRDHRFAYYTPSELLGWRNWLYSKRVFYLGGRVTVLGVSIEWTDYYRA